jgi:hypothetical protein
MAHDSIDIIYVAPPAKNMKKILFYTLAILSFSTSIHTQGLEARLGLFDQSNAVGYLQPLLCTISAGLNSGLYNSAKVLPPFRANLKISSALVMIPSTDKTFIAVAPNITIDGTTKIWEDAETATIFGDKGGQWVSKNFFGHTFMDLRRLPDGVLKFDKIPLPHATLSFGLPLGNEVIFRYIPAIDIIDDVGGLSLWGMGLKHSIDQYLPDIWGINIALMGFMHSMNFGDIVKINSYKADLHTSKSMSVFTIYGGLGVGFADLDAKYVFERQNSAVVVDTTPESIEVKFSSPHHWNFTIGAKCRLSIFELFADYTFSHYSTVTAGLSIGF